MFKLCKSYALPHLNDSERTGLHVWLQQKHVLKMLPAILPLSLVLCVIIVEGFEVRVENSFKGKSRFFLVEVRSTLVFKFTAFSSVDKFPDSPPPLKQLHAHTLHMYVDITLTFLPGPPSQGVHRSTCPILHSPSTMGCSSADLSFQQHSRCLP